jgi:hypothetical protein
LCPLIKACIPILTLINRVKRIFFTKFCDLYRNLDLVTYEELYLYIFKCLYYNIILLIFAFIIDVIFLQQGKKVNFWFNVDILHINHEEIEIIILQDKLNY